MKKQKQKNCSDTRDEKLSKFHLRVCNITTFLLPRLGTSFHLLCVLNPQRHCHPSENEIAQSCTLQSTFLQLVLMPKSVKTNINFGQMP